MKLYLVLSNWATEDDSGLDTRLYYDYDHAYSHFKKLIEEEKDPYNSWVGDGVFDEHENYDEDLYELNCNPNYEDGEEHDLWWCIRKLDYSSCFTDIYLKVIGVE